MTAAQQQEQRQWRQRLPCSCSTTTAAPRPQQRLKEQRAQRRQWRMAAAHPTAPPPPRGPVARSWRRSGASRQLSAAPADSPPDITIYIHRHAAVYIGVTHLTGIAGMLLLSVTVVLARVRLRLRQREHTHFRGSIHLSRRQRCEAIPPPRPPCRQRSSSGCGPKVTSTVLKYANCRTRPQQAVRSNSTRTAVKYANLLARSPESAAAA
jgi:hypothetical protein